MKVYRGLTKTYNTNYKQDIVWVSTSFEHASMYSEGSKEGTVLCFEINDFSLHYIDLGFRSVETEVKMEELISRIKPYILEQYEKKVISKEKALQLMKSLSKITSTGYKQVWEHVHDKNLIAIFQEAGFNAIRQNEGLLKYKGNVVTYGILDKRLLRAC